MAWEWEAGSSSGLSGDRRKARRYAAAVLRSGDAAVAVLQGVEVVTGYGTLDGHYQHVAGTRTEGRRHGQRIRWTGPGVPG